MSKFKWFFIVIGIIINLVSIRLSWKVTGLAIIIFVFLMTAQGKPRKRSRFEVIKGR